MTPGAQRIAKDLMRPVKERRFVGEAENWVAKHLLSAHFFEISQIVPLALDLVRAVDAQAEALQELAFLPGPLTWFEWAQSDGGRGAVLAAETEENEALLISIDCEGFMATPLAFIDMQQLNAAEDGRFLARVCPLSEHCYPGVAERIACLIYGVCNLVNRPGSLPSREYRPHKGLVRDLSRKGMAGKFPLRGFTEIKLYVGPDGNGREAKDAGSTGEKCLHWVRAHKRTLPCGRIKIPAHWRGDPALGIKQSRYAVLPPRHNGAPAPLLT